MYKTKKDKAQDSTTRKISQSLEGMFRVAGQTSKSTKRLVSVVGSVLAIFNRKQWVTLILGMAAGTIAGHF